MKTKHVALALAAALAASSPSLVRAEEGGSGHYLPGATASFIDALPGRPAFAYLNAFTYYNGSASASRPRLWYGRKGHQLFHGASCAARHSNR